MKHSPVFWSHCSLTVVYTALTINHVTNTVPLSNVHVFCICLFVCAYARGCLSVFPLCVFFFVHGQSALTFQTVSASKNLSHLFFQEDQSCSTLCLMPLRSFVLIEDGRVRSILKKRLLAYCPLLCFCCFEFSQMILWPYL